MIVGHNVVLGSLKPHVKGTIFFDFFVIEMASLCDKNVAVTNGIPYRSSLPPAAQLLCPDPVATPERSSLPCALL